MILTIITTLVCFATAVLMFSSYFRKITLLRPLAVFLIFEGVMNMLIFILSELYPTSVVGDVINRIGIILILLYYIFILVMTKSKSKRKNNHKEEQ